MRGLRRGCHAHELEEILAAVLRWMPGAELAVPFEELDFRHEVSSYGLGALPVTW